jgi:hypothetical protein
MKIRALALLAILASGCLDAARLTPAAAPLAVYYSFDASPPAVLLPEVQSELGRILGPAGLRVTWRSISDSRGRVEEFPGILVFRFRGRCTFEGAADEEEHIATGLALAQTQVSDGHVLPFGNVNCNAVRRFIAPAVRDLRAQTRDAALGRGLARVVAHEIYHMLTGSEAHAREGISRSAHSRSDLTARSFSFGKAEVNWLRTWVEKQENPTSLDGLLAEDPVRSYDAGSGESETAVFAGR